MTQDWVAVLAKHIIEWKPKTLTQRDVWEKIPTPNRVLPVANGAWLEVGFGEVILVEDDGTKTLIEPDHAAAWLVVLGGEG
jgi:hypothetical protein